MLRKTFGKRIVTLLLAVLALGLLTSCGEDAPDAGRYVCVAASAEGFTLEPEELYPKGAVLELGTGGRGLLTLGEESGSLRWSLNGTELTLNMGGERLRGTLLDGIIDLSLADGRVQLRFAREDLAAEAATPVPQLGAEDLERWCGDWFGRWSIQNSEGTLADTWYDSFARIEPDEDGVHLILTIWDEDSSYAQPIGTAELALSAEGERGSGQVALSTAGSFWFQEIGPGQWVLDPGAGEYPDMLQLSGRHESAEETFDYAITLRPWGLRWDDVEQADDSALPFHYEWYLSQIRDGQTMPEEFSQAD